MISNKIFFIVMAIFDLLITIVNALSSNSIIGRTLIVVIGVIAICINIYGALDE